MSNQCRSLTIETAYQKVAALQWGKPGGRNILAIHGWLDNAQSFSAVAPFFPDCNLIAIDLPGHGWSDHKARGAFYHYVDYVAVVLSVIDSLQWEKCTVLGHSLGAGIAAFCASLDQQRIRELIMIEGIGPFSSNPEQARGNLSEAVGQMAQALRSKPVIYETLDEMIRARAAVSNISYESAARIVQRNTLFNGVGYRWATDRRLKVRSPYYLAEEHVQGILQGITQPGLLIFDEGGMLEKRPEMAKRRKILTTMRYRALGGGHHLHLEQPAPVAKAIAEFLGI